MTNSSSTSSGAAARRSTGSELAPLVDATEQRFVVANPQVSLHVPPTGKDVEGRPTWPETVNLGPAGTLPVSEGFVSVPRHAVLVPRDEEELRHFRLLASIGVLSPEQARP